jgi:small-conductance mechanosensitive channel
VAYGSDVPLVMATLERCLRDNSDILDWPIPQVLFRAFGESSLDFEARGSIANIETIYQVQSALLVAIDQAFREANIEIPFPQRDLHLKGFEGLLAAGKSDGEP